MHQQNQVSQETPEQHQLVLTDNDQVFLNAWRTGVKLAGESLFGCQAATPDHATHWHQLTPKLDVMRRKLQDRSQSDAVFAAAMASLYNAQEGHKLMKKVGCETFGSVFTALSPDQRAVLSELMASYQRW